MFDMRQGLFDDLDSRKRAISNWKKIKILLVFMKMFGGKTNELE